MEKVKLDLIPGKVLPVCHASQYDVGRIIRFDLVENDTPYTLDGTETVTLGERKIDGNVVTAALTVVASKTYVDLTTTEQMTACYGQNLCELKIEKGSDIIGTLNFVLDVERDPLDGGIQSQSEIYNLQVQIDEIIQQELENYDIYGAYVTEQTSGAVASFTDGADDVPVKALSVDFSASQASGTPTPSAPIPIVGVDKVNVTRTGKNLLKKDIVYYNSNLNTLENCFFIKKGSYIVSFGSISNATSWRFSIAIKDKSGNNLTTSEYSPATGFANTGNRWRYGANQTTKSQVLNFAEDCYIRIFLELGDTSSSTVVSNGQLELGSTATAYEPYQGTTALINLGGTYYGGSVDVVTGLISVTHRLLTFDKNSTWTRNTSGVFYVYLTASVQSRILDLDKCNYFEVYLPKGSSGALSDGQCRLNANATTINFKITSCDTVEDFKTWLGDNTIQVVYSLATPIVVYASNTAEIPTILGVNNIFSDAGDVDVTYRADTALYIDKRLNA